MFIVLAFVVGSLMLLYYHDRFVFYYAEIYTNVTIWGLILLTPLVLCWLIRMPPVARDLAKRPITWQRNLVGMPLGAATVVGLFFAGPLGWVFAVAAWSGGTIHYVNATALKVGTYSKRKGCDQSATLRFASVDKETCMDNLYPPSAMREGELLNVGTTVYPFGFLIVTIASADRAQSTTHQGNSASAN